MKEQPDLFQAGTQQAELVEKSIGRLYQGLASPFAKKENLTHAMRRYQLLKSETLPPTQALPENSLMPFGPNSAFTGREDELLSLAESVRNKKITIVAPHPGCQEPGIGKTELVRAFVHHYGQAFEGGVFWLRFDDSRNLPLQVASAGNLMELENFDSLPLNERLEQVLLEWQGLMPRLLIFDHCDQPGLAMSWTPPAGGCRVIVLSNNAQWPQSEHTQTLLLEGMPPEDSEELVNAYSDRQLSNLRTLAQMVRGNPMALRLASAFLSQSQVDTNTLLDLMAGVEIPESLAQAGPLEHSPTVRLFALLFEFLGQMGENDTLNALRNLTVFQGGGPIPEKLFRSVLLADQEHEDADDIIEKLTDWGILSEGEHRFHRLLPTLVEHFLGRGEAGPLTTATIVALKQTHGQIQLQQAFNWRPHLSKTAARTVEIINQEPNQALVFANYLLQYGDPMSAFTLSLLVTRHYHQEKGKEGRQTVEAVDVLALALAGLGNSADALKVLCPSLESEEHPFTDQDRELLSKLVLNFSNNEVSLAYYSTPKFQKELEHTDNPVISDVLEGMAKMFLLYKRIAEAKQCLTGAIHVRRKVFGNHHKRLLSPLDGLATIARHNQNQAGLRQCLLQILAIFEKSEGPTHASLVKIHTELGQMAGRAGDHNEAKKRFLVAKKILQINYGEDSDQARMFEAFVMAFQSQNSTKRAKPQRPRAVPRAVAEQIEAEPEQETRPEPAQAAAEIPEASGSYEMDQEDDSYSAEESEAEEAPAEGSSDLEELRQFSYYRNLRV